MKMRQVNKEILLRRNVVKENWLAAYNIVEEFLKEHPNSELHVNNYWDENTISIEISCWNHEKEGDSCINNNVKNIKECEDEGSV